MADRYAVATGNWNSTATWSATSGGAPGASVPTSADNVFLNAASGAITVTLSATGACNNFDCTGFTGTLAGAFALSISGNVTVGSGMTWTHSGALQIQAACSFTSNGKTIASSVSTNSASTSLTLADALNTTNTITVNFGTFTTNNYNVTASSLSSSNSNTRTINLGSSTVTLSGDVQFGTSTNLTFNAGTSSITTTANAVNINGGTGVTFYNVTRGGSSLTGAFSIAGANTFNNLTINPRTSAGINVVSISANQTINGTLTVSAGTNATMRTFVRSDTIGTTRTLTCAAVASLTDIDFRDITIAGAAVSGGNLTGTRLGDCKGNSGITFDAAKTVYWGTTSSGNWGAALWASSVGGTTSDTNFPLAQDTAVFPSSYPATFTTVTINAAYNIGTIDMSARTSNAMTLATGTQTPSIYGNWINGTGTTLTGTGTLTFAGRVSQTITSAGKTFTQLFTINSPGGTVSLADAFAGSAAGSVILVSAGTFDAAGYNVSLTGTTSRFDSTGTGVRTVAIGTGTWTIAGSGSAWNATTSTNLTVTGTGTISLTSASAKTFAGGGIQTYPTLNQGGTGTLTVTGSNKFANLTNTAIGRIQFTGGTTNIFDSFTISGTSGNLLQLGSTNTTQATLQKGSAWLMGANSTDGGNNTGLSFTAGGGIDYLSVSYINGTVVAPPPTSTGNFFFFF